MDAEKFAETRRRAATQAFVRYFSLVFVIVAMLSGFTAYAVLQSRAQARDARAIRVEYCREIEKLKAENRASARDDMAHYARNLRLLGLKDTPELRRAAEESWTARLRRNAPKPCPYDG